MMSSLSFPPLSPLVLCLPRCCLHSLLLWTAFLHKMGSQRAQVYVPPAEPTSMENSTDKFWKGTRQGLLKKEG